MCGLGEPREVAQERIPANQTTEDRIAAQSTERLGLEEVLAIGVGQPRRLKIDVRPLLQCAQDQRRLTDTTTPIKDNKRGRLAGQFTLQYGEFSGATYEHIRHLETR